MGCVTNLLDEFRQPTEFELAKWEREEAERAAQLKPFREKFGSYDDWSMDDLHYLLSEMKEGFRESDDFSFISVAGIGMAQDGISRSHADLPAAVLNDMWLASDVLINLHDDVLDHQTPKSVQLTLTANNTQ